MDKSRGFRPCGSRVALTLSPSAQEQLPLLKNSALRLVIKEYSDEFIVKVDI